MDFEISNLNSLGKLKDRAVRGALPSRTNSKSSGKVWVSTEGATNDYPSKEYLVQPDVQSNTFTGTASFKVGSNKITTYSGSFSGLSTGDVIRRDGDVAYYAITSVHSSYVLVDKNYVNDQAPVAGTVLAGPYTARKVLFGNLSYQSYENTEADPNNFSVDKVSQTWQLSSDAEASGPFASESPGFKDGVSLHMLGRQNSYQPDMQSVGQVSGHVISVAAEDGAGSISLPVVPYPADHSSLRVAEKLLGSGTYTELTNGVDYFVDYTGNPVPSISPQPPFRRRAAARLHRTKRFDAWRGIDSGYGGQWAVGNKSGRVTNVLLGDEEVYIGDAENPPYVSEEHEVTADDLLNGGFRLQVEPLTKVALNIWEGAAQSDGPDFKVVGDWLSWKGLGLESELYLGCVLRAFYQSSGDRIKLYLYKDYLLDAPAGIVTTITPLSGAVFTVQHISVTEVDVQNKFVLLASAPVGPIAVNVTSGPAQRLGVDFILEGNRVSWSGLGMDTAQMRPGVVLRVFYQSGSGEEPVQYMQHSAAILKFGLDAYRKKGSFSSIDPGDSSSWGTRMEFGTEYNVNEGNGSFHLASGLGDNELVFFAYHGKGYGVETEILDPSKAPAGVFSDALRVKYAPIAPSTCSIKAFGTGVTRNLSEGTDYLLASDTGVITLLTPHRKGEKYQVSYLPSVPNFYAVSESETTGKYKTRAYSEPARVSSRTTIAVFNKQAAENGIDLATLEVRKASGKLLALKGATFNKARGLLVFDENASLDTGEVLVLDYEFLADALPFAPLVRLTKSLKAGQELVQTDGYPGSTELVAGAVVGISSYGTGPRHYYQVRGAYNATGVNASLLLNSPLSENYFEPHFMVTDTAVAFNAVQGLSAAPVVAGGSSMTVDGDRRLEFLPGKMMLLESSNKSEVYRVKTVRYDDASSSTVVTVDPPFHTSETSPSVLADIKLSLTVVYQEGDNALVTSYPVYSGNFPLWNISYLPQENGGYATVQINQDQVLVTEYLPEGKNEYTVRVESGFNVDSVATSIEALGGGGKFSVGWLFPKGGGIITDNLERSQAAFQMPYVANARAQVKKKSAGDANYRVLEWGDSAGAGDYHISGGMVLLEDPMVFGDRYVVTYVGVNDLRQYRGRSLQMDGRRLLGIPGRSFYNVSCDYLHPDQYYLEAHEYKTFLDGVVGPYLEQVSQSREGGSPGGVVPPADKEGSDLAEIGVPDMLYALRDEKLKFDLYWRAYEYYAGRMGKFATEYQGMASSRFANCEFSGGTEDQRFNLVSRQDIDVFAAFGAAAFSPVGHDGYGPNRDARFTGLYRSYGSAHFFNYGGAGVMLSADGLFKTRGLKAGDAIRIGGTRTFYTIASIVSESELKFTQLITGRPVNSGYQHVSGKYQQKVAPLFPWLGSPTTVDAPSSGTSYWVRLQSAPTFPLVDHTGCPCATARSDASEPYALSDGSSWSNVLCLEASTDFGASWKAYEVDLSFLTGPYTADKVAQAIQEGASAYDPEDPTKTVTVSGLSSLLVSSVERVYAPEGVDVEKSMDVTWPFSFPDKMDRNGITRVLVLRALSPSTWFRFVEPEAPDTTVRKTGASTLGFSTNVVFKGNVDKTGANGRAETEQSVRTSEIGVARTLLGLYDKMDRASSALYTPLYLGAVKKSNAALDSYVTSLHTAKDAAEGIMVETDATPAIQDSYAQASSMVTKYESQLGLSEDMAGDDGTLVKALQSNPSAWECSVGDALMSKATAASQAQTSYATSGVPTITLTAPSDDDARVIFGDGSEQYEFGGKKLFPSYVQSSVPAGQYDPLVKCNWVSSPVGNVGALYLSAVSGVLSPRATIDKNGVTLNYSVTSKGLTTKGKPISFLFSKYATVKLLVDAINSGSGGKFKARVANGSSSVLTPSQEALYGGIPSKRLLPADGKAVPCFLEVHGRYYSSGHSTAIAMRKALTISPQIPGTHTVDVTDSSIVVHTPASGNITVAYTGSQTLSRIASNLAAALGPDYKVTWDSLKDGGYKVGSLVNIAGLALPGSLFFGVKGDIRYRTISDKNLNDRIGLLQERIDSLEAAQASYKTRATQIASSVSASGEDLYNNLFSWLTYIADKEAGPCVRIPALKKRFMDSTIAKLNA